jgi:hypothetical protein
MLSHLLTCGEFAEAGTVAHQVVGAEKAHSQCSLDSVISSGSSGILNWPIWPRSAHLFAEDQTCLERPLYAGEETVAIRFRFSTAR